MSNKESVVDLGSGAGAGAGTGWKSSKWGQSDDPRGVEESRDLYKNRNSNRNSQKDKDRDRNRDRDRGVVEVRAEDVDDSAELASYFEGMNKSKNKRVEGGGPVMIRPVSIIEDARGAEGELSMGGSAGDRRSAYGMRLPLREVMT